MITWIGLCAGEIWRYLDAHDGESTLGAMVSEIDAPRETILMAIGWLARERYILLNGGLPDPLITLNPRLPTKAG